MRDCHRSAHQVKRNLRLSEVPQRAGDPVLAECVYLLSVSIVGDRR